MLPSWPLALTVAQKCWRLLSTHTQSRVPNYFLSLEINHALTQRSLVITFILCCYNAIFDFVKKVECSLEFHFFLCFLVKINMSHRCNQPIAITCTVFRIHDCQHCLLITQLLTAFSVNLFNEDLYDCVTCLHYDLKYFLAFFC